MKRLAIVTTHPIQYYAPLFKLLTERKSIAIKVFYTWGREAKGQLFDPGFGRSRQWDIPLLEGYEYEFIENISSRPGSHHFNGIINPELVKKIAVWKPVAILVIGWKFRSHLAVLFHFKRKIPLLFYGDSTLLDEAEGIGLKKILRHLLLAVVYSYIDYALFPGINSRAYFSACRVPEKKMIFAPHAVDNFRFGCLETGYAEEALQWKEKLYIPSDKPAVLFAGKLEPKKNPLFLVEAAATFPEMHFIIVGNGEQEPLIRDKVQGLPNLTLLPFQNQSKMPVVYRLADIFVLPSKGPGETWGLALNEAMASGRIVIASNKCGGAADLIKNGENGFIIEPCYNKLFEALNKLLEIRSSWDEMKKRSTELIRPYSLDILCSSVESAVNNKACA